MDFIQLCIISILVHTIAIEDTAVAFQSIRWFDSTRATGKSCRRTCRKSNNVVCFFSRRNTGGKKKNNDDFGSREKQRSFGDNFGYSEDAAAMLLEYSIDSFLRGDYDRAFSEDAASPLPGLSPRDTVDAALRSLRDLDIPEPSHGAAVLFRFCVELGRGERWGIDNQSNKAKKNSTFKELLRGSLTPTMLAKRIRSSEEFSGLLDWVKLDVTDGVQPLQSNSALHDNNIAFVNAALYFDQSSPPELYQIKLRKMLGGVWLIDTLQQSPSSLFQQQQQYNLPSNSSSLSSFESSTANARRKSEDSDFEKESPKERRRRGQDQDQQQRGKPRGKQVNKTKRQKKDDDDDSPK